MAYEMLTRSGRSFWEVTSAMQNAIRKGDYEIAGYAMWELLPQYTPYLRKRLLVISAEDCYGIITKEILKLMDQGDEDALTKALSLMCLAKKNRDADYFVCNLMNFDQPSGMDKHELSKALLTAIRKMDVGASGKYAAELFKKNRKAFWEMLHTAAQIYYPHLEDEFKALNDSNDRMSKPAEETIFVAKAIILIWTAIVNHRKNLNVNQLLGYGAVRFDEALSPADVPFIKPLAECRRIEGLFPEWAYNWHTSYGKYKLRRDAVHAIENDQRLLTPLQENLFDDCTWNVDLNACLLKHNPRNYRLPYNDGKRDPLEKYGKQE